MVAPSFLAKTSGSNSGTFTATLPAGWAAGDLAVFYTSYSAGGRISAVPAGWTKVAGPATGRGLDLAYKVLEAGDTNPSFTTDGQKWALLVYRDVHHATPVDAQTFATGTANPVVSPDVTATYKDSLRIHLDGNANNTGQYPTGMTGRHFHDGTAYNAASSWADEVLAAAGATGTRSNSPASSSNWVAWSLVIRPPNTPPNAPTLTNPVGGATIDRTATQRFAWDFNDPDAGDSQSQYELRYRLVGAGTWTTVGPNASTNTFHDFAASTFADGDYEWQARTWDAQGEVGPWAAAEFFTAATPPATPTITDPIAGQTIPTESYTVTHSAPDQDRVERRRVADNAGSPDTATVYWSELQASSTSRSRSVAFPVNNRWEHVQVRIEHNGLWSEWASARVEVSYTPPASPSGSTATHSSGAAVDVSGTNPVPAGDEPTVTEMRLYVRSEVDPHRPPEGIRIAVGEPANPTYTDWEVASGVAYEWRWQAIGDNGTSSYSSWFA